MSVYIDKTFSLSSLDSLIVLKLYTKCTRVTLCSPFLIGATSLQSNGLADHLCGGQLRQVLQSKDVGDGGDGGGGAIFSPSAY